VFCWLVLGAYIVDLYNFRKRDPGVVIYSEVVSILSTRPPRCQSHFGFGFGFFEPSYKSLGNMRKSCERIYRKLLLSVMSFLKCRDL